MFTESQTTDSSSENSNDTTFYVIIAALAVVVVALVVSTAFACVFKQRLDKLTHQQDGYETPTTGPRVNRDNPAYAGMYMDVM